MSFNVGDREFVIPGQLLGEKIRCGVNCFREGDGVYSSVSGIVRLDNELVKVMSSHGSYIPKPDDTIIGVIEHVTTANWFLSTGQPYRNILPGEEATRKPMDEDLTQYYDVGDLVSAKIRFVDEVYTSILSRPWKLEGGRILEVDPHRISRVIGRKRSMLNMLKDKTGSKIVVGQNGWVWIKGGDEEAAAAAVKEIEAKTHSRGLTARIGSMLDEKRKQNQDQ